MGPIVRFDQATLDFKKIPVLAPQQRTLRLLNDSVIPAEVRIFTKTKRSVFAVDVHEAVIAPHESINVTVTVCSQCWCFVFVSHYLILWFPIGDAERGDAIP